MFCVDEDPPGLKTLHPTGGASTHPSATVKLRIRSLSIPACAFFVVATIATDGSDDRRVSLLDELVEFDFVTIDRSPDIDHFRSIEGLGEASSIPLDHRDFAASFASLKLKSCTVYLQQTFPRILQIQYSTTGAIVGLMMDNAGSLILNGMEGRAPALLLVKAARSARSWSSRPIWSPW